MTCENPGNYLELLNCEHNNDKLCSKVLTNVNGGNKYTEVLAQMFGFWHLDKNLLFYGYLGDENTKINKNINNKQRKYFSKMINNIYKFDYHKDPGGNQKKSYFFLKVINNFEKTSKKIKFIIDGRLGVKMICASTAPLLSDRLGYLHRTLFKMRIIDHNLEDTDMYFYLGIRNVDGINRLTFDGSIIPIRISECSGFESEECSNFTIDSLQELEIPIFNFSQDVDLNHQSIYLNPYNLGNGQIEFTNISGIENARKEADKSCVNQLNRFNRIDPDCKCINTADKSNINICEDREDLSENVVLPKYCSYLSNSDNSFQRGLSACQTAAYNKYEEEIKSLNDTAYNDWLYSETNDDNVRNVSLDISNKYKDLNNELMTKCPMMKLGINGIMNEEIREQVINDPKVNKVINKYIENKERLGLDINYDDRPDSSDNLLVDGEYYSNIHPLKECKPDSYKLMQKICNDYSLPTDDDPLAYVLPRKCTVTDFKDLLYECDLKNQPEIGSGDDKELERILPFNLETEEGNSGSCNNIKMDTLGLDNTRETWNQMWKQHNKSLDRIGTIVNNTLEIEDAYLTKKKETMKIYEDSLDKLDDINNKKNCALLGRTWTGVPNDPPDGTNCGEKLETNYKNLFIEKSLPVCMYNRNKFNIEHEKRMGYLKIGIGFVILFLIIYLVSKKMTN